MHVKKCSATDIFLLTQEAVRKICCWEYINCIDLWVRFISANIHDHDLQSLFFMTVQLVNGLAHMFTGPRYLPLRLKCVEWLNCLSSSSGQFIPIASLLLDILEYKVVREARKAQNAFNIAAVLKVRILFILSWPIDLMPNFLKFILYLDLATL